MDPAPVSRALPCLVDIHCSALEVFSIPVSRLRCNRLFCVGCATQLGRPASERMRGALPDHIPNVLQGEYYRQIEPVKERLFRELFADGQVHRLAELGIGTGPNQGFYASQQASLLPEG